MNSHQTYNLYLLCIYFCQQHTIHFFVKHISLHQGTAIIHTVNNSESPRIPFRCIQTQEQKCNVLHLTRPVAALAFFFCLWFFFFFFYQIILYCFLYTTNTNNIQPVHVYIIIHSTTKRKKKRKKENHQTTSSPLNNIKP